MAFYDLIACDEKYNIMMHVGNDVTRLDGAPIFEFEVFRKQIYCIEEST